MAHTPGPWTWHVDKPATERETAEISIDSLFGQVAEVFTENCDDNDQCESDARLIAAAPDLLAACEEWVRYFDKLMADDEPGDPLAEARNSFHRKRVEQTRAAIAKAKGAS